MPEKLKKVVKEEYTRIRRALEKVFNPELKKTHPKWVLQPVKSGRQ